MSMLSYTLRNRGLINFPGVSPSSKKIAEDLLLKDAEKHHCFFCTASRHNHLIHHILAAYDLGAPPGLLQKIYDQEESIQRPILLETADKNILVTDGNWTQYIGNPSAYKGFIEFFSNQIQSLGASRLLSKYIFSSDANKKGVNMLIRLVSNGLHPFIQIGYGTEFRNDTLIVTGLAQTAVHSHWPEEFFDFLDASVDVQRNAASKTQGRQPSKGLSFLGILRQVYDSEILRPPMYDPNALFKTHVRSEIVDERTKEIARICSLYHADGTLGEEELNEKVEECIWVSVLLLFSTGKRGREIRLDFFFVHLLTASLFFFPLFNLVDEAADKAMLLRAYVGGVVYYMLARGRPRINPDLLMTYTDKPRPPTPASTMYKPDSSSLGSPLEDADYNPWPVLVGAVVYASDAHTVKIMRALLFAAQKYGDTSSGHVIGVRELGEETRETHQGAMKLDGTVFARAAGMLMEYTGWISYGQSAREDWDTSGLGWDAAWNNV